MRLPPRSLAAAPRDAPAREAAPLRETRPLSGHDQGYGGEEQDESDDAHAERIGAWPPSVPGASSRATSSRRRGPAATAPMWAASRRRSRRTRAARRARTRRDR